MFMGSAQFRRSTYVLLGVGIVCELLLLYEGTLGWMITAWVEFAPDRIGACVPILFCIIAIFHLIRQAPDSIRTEPKGLAVLVLSLGAFFIGYAVDIYFVRAASFILLGFGITLYVGGHHLARKLFFPFGFLILMVPSVSFLLESVAGRPFRQMITVLSGVCLNITGGPWHRMDGALQLNEIVMPVQYATDSLSSPLALLILTCVAAEIMFYKNRYKFVLVGLFGMLFVAAHSLFTIVMGWSAEYHLDTLAEILWTYKNWLPALLFAGFLAVARGIVPVRLAKGGRSYSGYGAFADA